MNWYDAMPGSSFMLRPACEDDIARVVDDMDTRQFSRHFEHDLSHREAIEAARKVFAMRCDTRLAFVDDAGPFYVMAVFPLPPGEPCRTLMYGLPARGIRKHGAQVVRWAKRKLVPHMRDAGMLPMAVQEQEEAKDTRWLLAMGAMPATMNGYPCLVWER